MTPVVSGRTHRRLGTVCHLHRADARHRGDDGDSERTVAALSAATSCLCIGFVGVLSLIALARARRSQAEESVGLGPAVRATPGRRARAGHHTRESTRHAVKTR
ncbi:hypothetical protein MBT84_18295 [Streptomyces sp. MBT84]|nr:hypothetical protein [Streptomyces sp. MBT84]